MSDDLEDRLLCTVLEKAEEIKKSNSEQEPLNELVSALKVFRTKFKEHHEAFGKKLGFTHSNEQPSWFYNGVPVEMDPDHVTHILNMWIKYMKTLTQGNS